MTTEQRSRYLELSEKLQQARQMKSEARENNDIELARDADSKADYVNGAMSEIELWFGKFEVL